MSEKTTLFSEFQGVSKTEFQNQILKDLKGKDYEETLFQKNFENLEIAPFYVEADLDNINHAKSLPGNFPFVRGNKIKGNNWEIRQDFKVNEIKAANNKALDALMKGVDSLGFEIEHSELTQNFIAELLEDILLEHISLNFVSNNQSLSILKDFINEVIKRKIDTNQIKGSVNFDPLGHLLLHGNWADDEELAKQDAFNLVTLLNKHLPFYRGINISADHYHNAGASITQELAFSLSQANYYLENLTEKGLKIDDITSRIQFTFATGSNYLMEIAKLRAFRLLWARLVEQYQTLHTCSMVTFVHAVTSKWNQTIFDPHVNLLRATTETMSAAIGGADSILVTPFDAAYKTPDEFSERMARNNQIILSEEAYLNKVADPAGGSYYLENLTDSMAEAAWKLFQQVEQKGGFVEALKQNFIQEEIEQVAKLKKQAFENGKIVLVGTNKYPNLKEETTAKYENNATEILDKETFIKPLKPFRLAFDLEKKRFEESKIHEAK